MSNIGIWSTITLGLVFTYNACTPMQSLNSSHSASVSSEAMRSQHSLETFKTTLYPVVTANCVQCHGNVQNPMFASSNIKEAHQTLLSNQLVNLADPTQSHMIAKLNSGHNSFPASLVDEVQRAILVWSQTMTQFDHEHTPPVAGELEFAPTEKSSIVMKAKSLTHGGALTQEELDSLTSTEKAPEELRKLVKQWIETPEGLMKMDHYISLALHQDIILGAESRLLFRSVSRPEFQDTLRESSSRTIRDLIDRGRPFNEIATVRRWAVNSVLLTAMGWMDDTQRRMDGTDYALFLGANATPEDYKDWRFVTFSDQRGTTAIPAYTDLAYWRSVKDGDTVVFGVPRVGYFTTLAFQSKYPTNSDNDFRITMNQTMIAGLGKTYSPSDTTDQPLLVGIPENHAVKGTQCYACHRLMDPMRLAFRQMDERYRPNLKFQPGMISFAFRGLINPMTSITDLGSAIANHPDFAEAWVQKMCNVINTRSCAVTDPEFKTIVSRFKMSNFNFKEMYADVLASDMLTGRKSTVTTQSLGFDIPRIRAQHLCHSLAAKIRQVQIRRGLVVQDFDGGKRICPPLSNMAIRVGALGDDEAVRGEEKVVNSFPVDVFAVQSMERICQQFAAATTNSNVVFNQAAASLEMNLDLLTEFVAGLPPGHTRYKLMRDGLKATYAKGVELGMGPSAALQQAIILACTSPEVVGMGL